MNFDNTYSSGLHAGQARRWIHNNAIITFLIRMLSQSIIIVKQTSSSAQTKNWQDNAIYICSELLTLEAELKLHQLIHTISILIPYLKNSFYKWHLMLMTSLFWPFFHDIGCLFANLIIVFIVNFLLNSAMKMNRNVVIFSYLKWN